MIRYGMFIGCSLLSVAVVAVAGCGENSCSFCVTSGASSQSETSPPEKSQPEASEPAENDVREQPTAAVLPAAEAVPQAVAKPKEIVHKASLQVAQGGDGRAKNVTFDTIKFPMPDPKSRDFKPEYLTDSIRQLNGNRVRIRGFILPTFVDEFAQFQLVRDNAECCYGPGAALYDSVAINLEEGKTTRFVVRPVTVEGTFEIREVIGPDNKHWSVYHITATKVE